MAHREEAQFIVKKDINIEDASLCSMIGEDVQAGIRFINFGSSVSRTSLACVPVLKGASMHFATSQSL